MRELKKRARNARLGRGSEIIPTHKTNALSLILWGLERKIENE